MSGREFGYKFHKVALIQSCDFQFVLTVQGVQTGAHVVSLTTLTWLFPCFT